MKKVLFIFFAIVILFVSCSGGTVETVRVRNSTGFTGHRLAINDSEDLSWYTIDILGGELLNNGETRTVTTPEPLDPKRRYDITLTDGDGNTYAKYYVRVRTNKLFTFYFHDIEF